MPPTAPSASSTRSRVYFDWNDQSEPDGTHRALWKLVRHDGTVLIDYPEPSPGDAVAIGEGEDWFAGVVTEAGLRPTPSGREHGVAFVHVDFEQRLDIHEP